MGGRNIVEGRINGSLIDLKDRQCLLQEGTAVPCVPMQYCLTYDGHGVPAEMGEASWAGTTG